MGLKEDITSRVDEQLSAHYEVSGATVVPSKSSLTFSATAKKIYARVLYADIRGSKAIVSKAGPLAALKVHKAFLYAVSKCVRDKGGNPVQFGGDSALSFFAGSSGAIAKNAVRCAMKVKWALDDIVRPKVLAKLGVELDYGIGIGQGDVHVGKSGIAGDEQFQDLVWIGWPVYHAVAYGDRAARPKSIWISENIWSAIKDDESMTHSNGDKMWVYADEKFDHLGTVRVHKTNYRITS